MVIASPRKREAYMLCRRTKARRLGNKRALLPLSCEPQESTMGLLDSILPGNQSGKGGGISPITLGLLALLAYRTYQGKGRLADMLPRGAPAPNTGPGSLPGRDQPGSATDAGGLGSIL